MEESIFQIDDLNNKDIRDDEDLAQFDLSLKKKKKKKKVTEDDKKIEKSYDEKDENNKEEYVFEDYDYVYLLDRFYTVLREKNPSLAVRKRQVIPPPILHGLGKKTMWSNFAVVVGILKRSIEHVQSYINYELSTDSSIDGNSRLIIKGKFSSKNLEPVLRKYILAYVSCSMCKSHETSLVKDPITRVCFIKCDTCKSTKSVDATIKKPCRV
jgi:translation initiation factor 2 subunit 2